MGYRQFLDKKITLALMILLLLSGLISSCSASPTATQEPSDDQVLALVQEVSASGEVVPIQWVTLSYPTGADQLELRVSEGDQVSKDAILVKNIDHRLMASLNQAQAALARAQLAYDQTLNAPTEQAILNADSAYLNAYANLIRQEDLDADESLIEAAQADVDAAYLNLLTTFEGASDQEIAAAAHDLRAAELAVTQAEAAFDIKAPFDGTVVEIFVNVGEPVGAYQPVLTIADLTNFQVITTDLSEVDVAQLVEGQTASIVFDAIPESTFLGTVEKIADKSSGVSSVYYQVTLSLNEIPPEIRWGMTAFVIFPVD